MSVPAQQQNPNDPRLSFVNNTAFWTLQGPDIVRPVGGGLSTPWSLPRTGLLARLRLAVRGSIAGGLSLPNANGMASIINRIRFSVNAGLDQITFSGTGYHYALREAIDSEYVDPVGQSNARSAVTATTFNLDMVIPVALNLRDPIGLINLQDTALTCQLNVDWTPDVTVATGATVTGTVTPYLDLFTVPPPPARMPNLSIIQNITEDSRQISGAGDYQYDILLGMQYMQIMHLVSAGLQAGTDSWSKYQLRSQQNVYPMITDVKGHDIEFRAIRGRARPGGLIMVDRLGSSGLGNYGLMRDSIDSSKATDLASIVTATGAVPIITMRRGLTALAGAPLGGGR